MRRTTVGASTGVLLLLAALLAACGGGENQQGYVAMGPSDTSRAPAEPVAPTDDVTLTPLDGGAGAGGGDTGDSRTGGGDRGTGGGGGDTGRDAGSPGSAASPGAPDGHSPAAPGDGATHEPPPDAPEPSDRPHPPSGNGDGDGNGTTSPPPHSPSPDDDSPALLKVSAPDLTDTDDRWCEKVTLRFRNTGGRPVRSGTLTFKTHIIGGLGIDWDTRKTTRDLPAPIPAGESKKHAWKICVAAWRVPLGMHIDTKDVDVEWK
ncbi:hypothetical protein C3486_26445 [Streptomyces sp. Ru73]|uniref:hypothetical protein n=1 Tax=Streptomyces sp. Ru73 TaxID=2080748 RepID=UPI000CDD3A33|nr:hypothetical protein [Streptomyces sp. Ru73]POX37826.1 hypothetical protein C3486_26445 [Streptomyces sp. Ru73]